MNLVEWTNLVASLPPGPAYPGGKWTGWVFTLMPAKAYNVLRVGNASSYAVIDGIDVAKNPSRAPVLAQHRIDTAVLAMDQFLAESIARSVLS